MNDYQIDAIKSALRIAIMTAPYVRQEWICTLIDLCGGYNEYRDYCGF